jgi:hypothetical protein
MARNRMVKPEFWSDEKIGALSPVARLLFVGIWNFSDDEGKISGNMRFLKSSIFPYDKFAVEKYAKELEVALLICPYITNRSQYYFVRNFNKHQRIDKPQPSRLPDPRLSDPRVRKFLFDECGGVCPNCGREMIFKEERFLGRSSYSVAEGEDSTKLIDGADSRVFSIDHILPRKKGGTNTPSNLRAICLSCNKSKGYKDLDYFLEYSENVLGTEQERSAMNIKEDKLRKENIREEKEENDCVTSPEKKHPFGTENVLITEKEYEKLRAKLGSADAVKWCCEKLDNYLGQSEKNKNRYTSHYRAILSWVVDEWHEHCRKNHIKPHPDSGVDRRRNGSEGTKSLTDILSPLVVEPKQEGAQS